MNVYQSLTDSVIEATQSIFSVQLEEQDVSIAPTNPDFEGNYTVVVFQLLKKIKGNPVEIGTKIGEYITEHSPIVSEFNVVKGFLNLVISQNYWIEFIQQISSSYFQLGSTNQTVVLEYCGPNTNKPLHLGHMRNMLLGWSISEILMQAGNQVHKVNIYNDRGIAICKSMVAWRDYANGDTPESTGIKGDHFVGNYYVKYAEVEKEQAVPFLAKGIEEREANKQTAINKEAQNELLKWENGDADTIELWNTMNSWVFRGFEETYKQIGVDFEKNYYESKTYLLGKEIVEKGLKDGLFYQKEDGSIWVDLEEDGLDQKLLLRGDGTSVYITQDLGTAQERYFDFNMNRSIYVVGNEQDYHFQVLKAIEQKLDVPFANGIEHLSYGMVDLPTGKMKSREGTVVDADDLIQQMDDTAKEKTLERGKIEQLNEQELEQLYHQIGLGALKFFILRVDPQKRMLFNPEESIEFNGFTGPFIQYTFARIQSMLSKAEDVSADAHPENLLEAEVNIIQHISEYQNILAQAAEHLSPSLIATYVYQLAKLFNQLYEHVPILKEENKQLRDFRIHLCEKTAETIKICLRLLGIESPNQM